MSDDNLHVEVAVLKNVVETVSAALDKMDKRIERLETKVYGAMGSAIILGVMLGIYFLKSAFMK